MKRANFPGRVEVRRREAIERQTQMTEGVTKKHANEIALGNEYLMSHLKRVEEMIQNTQQNILDRVPHHGRKKIRQSKDSLV